MDKRLLKAHEIVVAALDEEAQSSQKDTFRAKVESLYRIGYELHGQPMITPDSKRINILQVKI